MRKFLAKRTEISPEREIFPGCCKNISILGEYDEKEVRKGLKACKGYMRSQLGQRLSLRNVPELTFEFDKSVEMGARIDKILREIEKSGEDGEQ